ALADAVARMAGEALIAVQINLIAFDGMRDERRLLGIVPYLFLGGVAHRRHARRLPFLIKRCVAAQRGVCLCEQSARCDGKYGDQSDDTKLSRHGSFLMPARSSRRIS